MVVIVKRKDDDSHLYIFFIKLFICIIVFLGLAIISKSNSIYKDKIYNYIYGTNIDFSSFKKIYNKYLGGVTSINESDDSKKKEEYVFGEKLKYNGIVSYKKGVKLNVSNNYLVPSLDNGIVVYVGEKDEYKSVVIIENEDGVDVWYGNICNSSLKLYDNVKSGNYVGESCNDYIYLVFSKNNTFLDYKNYIN